MVTAPPTAEFAAVRETHVGVVFLVGDRAYKLKKPVRTGFLDFSTPDRRLAACRRELELNRRLAPDVYLGISDVSAPHDGAQDRSGSGDAATATAEHLLVMRRMPGGRRLSALVRAGDPATGPLREVARLMAGFHASAERGPRITAEGGPEALRRRWTDNLEQAKAFRGRVLSEAVVDSIARLALRFIDGRGELFADRQAHDRIVDGHGDLIAEDVFCLDDGPRVLDCLEFDDQLRFVDGLDDVAFLAMDLERLGRPDLAQLFLGAYVEFSGDPAPAALRHHYVAYRAFVRAKVACLRHEQGDPPAAEDATGYAELAQRHLQDGAVRLALVGGLPGTGKTTLGGGLADRFGAVLLSSDRIRKELAGLDPTLPAAAGYRQGLYTPEHTDTLYRELLRRAGELLGRGESVVLDASWADAGHRHAAEALAHRTHSDLVRLQCRATAETAGRRILTRGPTASDATPAVATAMATDAGLWPEAVAIPTSGSIEDSLDRAAAVWRLTAARTTTHR
ncbi:bifunctional aminoglycoside phosphotransferase/ATP-binding protein [Pseudonocardia bannensis]|uniref:AAA family ATPase n=1 Tax=Pseudonocardia bannensis TaxID=630973 RepID=A0A848DEX7_9PSEU|nr:AAA family ATPase [Pseudonocardia bannensis]NMH91198.1 AAA family ATPase [Pseudonocardia bannensis]